MLKQQRYMYLTPLFIIQDEETLEFRYDPYQTIDSCVSEAYAEHTARIKDGSENALLGCLAVYRLNKLERLVVEQDGVVGNKGSQLGCCYSQVVSAMHR